MFYFSFRSDLYTKKEGPFTVFSIKPGDNFNTWLFQNGAEIVDAREGCLLDNYLIACKHGISICTEQYVNEWSSRYFIRFERGAGEAVYAAWEQFCAEYDHEYRTEEA